MEELLEDDLIEEQTYSKEELRDFILDNVEQCRKESGKISWVKLAYITGLEFDEEFTEEKIRGIYRKHTDPNFTTGNSARSRKSEARKEKITLRQHIVKRIKNKCSLDYLFDTISHPDEEILAELSRMEFEGFMVNKWSENGQLFLQTTKEKFLDEYVEINLDVEETISIAVIGDTHIGHQQSRTEELKSFINYAYNKGVRSVIHTGDWVEGHYMAIRPTSIRELSAIGFDEQLELANQVIPKLDGLTYYGISGNHDATFDRNSFANPVKTLAKIREDIVYLGHNFGRITVNKDTDIAIVHPSDKGVAQNYGLKIHQYIDKAEKDKQARIVLMGHYHKHSHIHFKGVDGFITPAFVAQSNFMRDNNLVSVVGGFILHLTFNKDKKLVSIIPEYVWFD